MCLQACLGADFRFRDDTLTFKESILPAFLTSLHIQRWRLGDSLIDLAFRRDEDNVRIDIESLTGSLKLAVK